MELRERVAKAIHESNRIVPWEQTSQQDLAFERADAAIAAVLDAMGEPTIGMCEAGVDNLFGAANEDWAVDAKEIWQAMLAAFRRDYFLSALAEADGDMIDLPPDSRGGK